MTKKTEFKNQTDTQTSNTHTEKNETTHFGGIQQNNTPTHMQLHSTHFPPLSIHLPSHLHHLSLASFCSYLCMCVCMYVCVFVSVCLCVSVG